VFEASTDDSEKGLFARTSGSSTRLCARCRTYPIFKKLQAGLPSFAQHYPQAC
jgi:hypothetical protein